MIVSRSIVSWSIGLPGCPAVEVAKHHTAETSADVKTIACFDDVRHVFAFLCAGAIKIALQIDLSHVFCPLNRLLCWEF